MHFDKLLQRFMGGHERSVQTKKNIAALFVLKGISIGISFMLVPMTLRYLTPVQYGIWLTLSSVIAWFSLFDIGLGNGLRNKFIEALTKGNIEQVRMYVSTTYVILTLIIGAVYIVFMMINPYLSWATIVNAETGMERELRLLAIVVFTFFCFRFIIGLLNTILIADQKPAASSFLEVLSNLLSLIVIYFLIKKTQGSLIYLGLAIGISTTLIPLLASFWYFNRSYKYCAPALSSVDMRSAKELINIGLKFFIIQIVAIVLFMSSNMVIAQLFGPKEVTSYNIAFKYFSVISLTFNIVLAPFWSAYTDAYFRDDIAWIKHATRRLLLFWTVTVVVAGLMILIADTVYLLWVGPSIEISVRLSIAMACYVIISNWNNIFVSFINGTGKIRLQLYSSLAVGIVNIPLSIILGKYFGLGIPGVVYASCVCLCAGALWAPLQSMKLMNKTAIGIWGK